MHSMDWLSPQARHTPGKVAGLRCDTPPPRNFRKSHRRGSFIDPDLSGTHVTIWEGNAGSRGHRQAYTWPKKKKNGLWDLKFHYHQAVLVTLLNQCHGKIPSWSSLRMGGCILAHSSRVQATLSGKASKPGCEADSLHTASAVRMHKEMSAYILLFSLVSIQGA